MDVNHVDLPTINPCIIWLIISLHFVTTFITDHLIGGVKLICISSEYILILYLFVHRARLILVIYNLISHLHFNNNKRSTYLSCIARIIPVHNITFAETISWTTCSIVAVLGGSIMAAYVTWWNPSTWKRNRKRHIRLCSFFDKYRGGAIHNFVF